MKTQISIQVKNENWISRCMSIYMSLGLFVKAKVNVYVDNMETPPVVLKARAEPYLIDIAPGEHILAFTTKSKAGIDKFLSGAMGAAIGAGLNGTFGAMVSAKGTSDFVSGVMGHNRVQNNLLECELREGDILKVRIQPKRNGAVKVTLL